jgi:hypothetical protein
MSFLFSSLCIGQKNDTLSIENDSSSLEEVSFYLKEEGEITLWYYYPKKQFLYYQKNKKVCSFEQTQKPIFNWWLWDSILGLVIFIVINLIKITKNNIHIIGVISSPIILMINIMAFMNADIMVIMFSTKLRVAINTIIIPIIVVGSYQNIWFAYNGVFLDENTENIDRTVDSYRKNKYRHKLLYTYIALEIIFLSLVFYALS